ncbi:RND efflux system outer membrane lipoprotein [Novosphingobium nitrogenifigens DSM 19370]|uniref:RND efflux system outer membrane lipoprotein n=1 Tax=Novosphingobium nitrogenifigens DSM 19370 TaxID=983920 RepID=F1Z6D3_9SPHN|nr:efflux transporter outer membrane subunit [Novosphingobium nitrogenifigens]EGD59915.1 RND efflux system outer membrane lipoprotein [Novosphingobium nitrogenifigens DSM 19370]
MPRRLAGKRLAGSGVLVSAFALAGCVMGPNYHVPEKAAASQAVAKAPFHEAPTTPGVTADTLPPRWWHMYDDPVLDKLEEDALAANTELRIAGANLARAQAFTRVTEGQGELEYSVDVMAERARLSGESFLRPNSVPVASIGEVKGAVNYQLDLFGRIKRSIEAARADEQASAAVIGAVKVTVAAEVAKAYIGQCAAREAQELAERQVEINEHALEVAKRINDAGRSSVGGVTEAEHRLALAKSAVPIRRARARAELYRLAFLLGRAPADYPREAERCHEIPKIERPLPIGDGAALIARRPDVRVAERELASATARVGVATASLYPDISIGVSGGAFGFIKDLGTAPANMWGVGGLLHWTIPTKSERARVRAANAEADAALAHFDGVVLDALRETETALAMYAEDHNRAVSIADALVAAREEAKEARELREGGRTPLLSAIGGQQTEIAAEIADSDIREAVALDQVGLFLALGGGW